MALQEAELVVKTPPNQSHFLTPPPIIGGQSCEGNWMLQEGENSKFWAPPPPLTHSQISLGPSVTNHRHFNKCLLLKPFWLPHKDAATKEGGRSSKIILGGPTGALDISPRKYFARIYLYFPPFLRQRACCKNNVRSSKLELMDFLLPKKRRKK